MVIGACGGGDRTLFEPRMSILNGSRIGKFSSDQTIRDDCAEIWKTWLVKIQL